MTVLLLGGTGEARALAAENIDFVSSLAGRVPEAERHHCRGGCDVLARSELVGQQGMRALHGGRTSFTSAHDLEIAPNLWSGVGLVRGGAGSALVGSHQEVAYRLAEYHRLGIDEFILSGYPHVEEAYWFAEGVMPLLRAKGIYGRNDGAHVSVRSA